MRQIPGYPEYLTDAAGQIFSEKYKKFLNHFLVKGYKKVGLYKDRRLKHVFVHRILALTWIDNPQNKPYVNHRDGNKLNNLLDNLEWVTAKENTTHAHATGLCTYTPSLIRSQRASILCRRINPQQETELRILKAQGKSNVELANRYNVSRQLIHKVLTKGYII